MAGRTAVVAMAEARWAEVATATETMEQGGSEVAATEAAAAAAVAETGTDQNRQQTGGRGQCTRSHPGR